MENKIRKITKNGEKNLKKNFFLNKKKKEENSTALQKGNVNMEVCRGNKQCDY